MSEADDADSTSSSRGPVAIRIETDSEDYHLTAGSKFTLCGLDYQRKQSTRGPIPSDGLFECCVECRYARTDQSMKEICSDIANKCGFDPVDPGTGFRKNELAVVLDRLMALEKYTNVPYSDECAVCGSDTDQEAYRDRVIYEDQSKSTWGRYAGHLCPDCGGVLMNNLNGF